MSEETREQHFLRLLSEEAESFERAASQSENAGPAQRENLARDWFGAQARLLNAYWRSEVFPCENPPLKPFPAGAIGRVAKLMETLSTGNIPDPVKDVTAAGGSPDKWPLKRRDIATAIDYIEHARRGVIAERAFIKKVTEAFRVDRSTVRDWLKKSDKITDGLKQIPAEDFPDALLKAGARYHFNRKGERTEGVK